MSELNFRAWNGYEMLTMPLETNFGISRFFGFIGETDIVMQSTGLEDKNGVEIFEGDIVKTDDGDIGAVIIINGAARFDRKKDDLEKTHSVLWQNKIHDSDKYFGVFDIEVVGNIYQQEEP